jgi:hypothetical protein
LLPKIHQLLAQFDHNPIPSRKALLDAWQADRERFLQAAVPILCSQGETSGQKFLISFLLQQERLAERFGDTRLLTREEAISLARLAIRVDPSLEVKLALRLASATAEQQADSGRILDILEAIAEPTSLLPVLGSILRHPDPKVRSKAALIMGKGNRNPSWAAQQLQETDPRVRANAIESLWGLQTDDAAEVFLSAAQDAHQRVAVNGLLGLYLSGRTQAIELKFSMAQHHDAAFRTSIAWAMGRTQDPRFIPCLARMVRESNPLIRSHALRSLTRLRNYRAMLEKAEPIHLFTRSATITPTGMRLIELSVRQHGRKDPLSLQALAFVLEEDGTPVLRFEVDALARSDRFLSLVLPDPAALDNESTAALQQAWATASALRQSHENWCAIGYRNLEPSAPPPMPAPNTAPTGLPFDVLLSHVAQTAAPGFIDALFAMPSARYRRHILLLGSTAPESTAIVFSRQARMERLRQQLAASNIVVHSLAPSRCPSLIRTALQNLASSSGGTYTHAPDPQSLASAFSRILLTQFPDHVIRYWGFPAHASPGNVSLLVHSPAGVGETTTTLGDAGTTQR